MGEKCPGVSSKQAGKTDSCRGCPNASYCAQPKQIDPDIEHIQQRLAGKTIVAVMSGKGGVGKSTVTRNIADALARRHVRTCILDLDLSGPSIPRLTGTDGASMGGSNNVVYPVEISEFLSAVSVGYLQESYDDAIVFGSSLKNATIKKLLRDCEYADTEVLLIDTPPNISDEHLAMASLVRPHLSIVVTTPQRLSLQDVVRQIDFCRKAGIRILGILENMKRFVCPQCHVSRNIFSDTGVEAYCVSAGIEYLGALELQQEIARSSDAGCPVLRDVFEDLADAIVRNKV